jgi:excisionase family DNA binding protein
MSQDAYMTPKEAAEYLRSSPSTLAKRRITGHSPRFSRIGAAIRYRRSDLDEWMAANVRRSTSEPREASLKDVLDACLQRASCDEGK